MPPLQIVVAVAVVVVGQARKAVQRRERRSSPEPRIHSPRSGYARPSPAVPRLKLTWGACCQSGEWDDDLPGCAKSKRFSARVPPFARDQAGQGCQAPDELLVGRTVCSGGRRLYASRTPVRPPGICHWTRPRRGSCSIPVLLLRRLADDDDSSSSSTGLLAVVREGALPLRERLSRPVCQPASLVASTRERLLGGLNNGPECTRDNNQRAPCAFLQACEPRITRRPITAYAVRTQFRACDDTQRCIATEWPPRPLIAAELGRSRYVLRMQPSPSEARAYIPLHCSAIQSAGGGTASDIGLACFPSGKRCLGGACNLAGVLFAASATALVHFLPKRVREGEVMHPVLHGVSRRGPEQVSTYCTEKKQSHATWIPPFWRSNLAWYVRSNEVVCKVLT